MLKTNSWFVGSGACQIYKNNYSRDTWAATKAFKTHYGNGEAAQVQEGPILTWVLKDEQAFLG